MRGAFPIVLLLAVMLDVMAASDSRYQEPAAFIQEVFGDDTPRPALLWLTDDIRKDVESILGHSLNLLRLRYWRTGSRSAWILDELGKERPITAGIAVDHGRIERIRVLVYRESRGSEVRHSFFTDQFAGATLRADSTLDRPIDGISGATLSVRALTKLARIALYLDGVLEAER